MSALSLDGKKLAARIQKDLAQRAAAFKKARGRAPKLTVVTGEGSAESSYMLALIKAAAATGVEADLHDDKSQNPASQARRLAADPTVDAVLIDRPGAADAAFAIPPSKDAEGLTPENYGRLFLVKKFSELAERGVIAPCTALAVAELLRSTEVPLAGKRAAVIGRSSILGRPAAHLLSTLGLTVTLCHSETRDLAEEISRADVVAACIGKPRMIQGAWIKKGSIVIDAGINMVAGKLCGDVEASAAERAAYLTPVPGGVGPVTTAMLLANTLTLAERAR